MSLHDDERLLTAVAAALGETIALVRSRGFHIDSRSAGCEPTRADLRYQRDADDGEMTVKMPSISRPTASTGTPAMTLGIVAVHGG